MQKRTITGPDPSPSFLPACSVLVVSCDKYKDLWTPFFTLFSRYWPDCEWPVYLGTNFAHPDVDYVRTIPAGEDEAWSKRLRFFLQQLTTEYVLLLLEDFFLDRPVSSDSIREHLKLLHSLDGASLRLFPNPYPDYVRKGIGVIHPRAAYRVSLQASIWNRSRLLDLLVDEESPWQFETRATLRSRSLQAGFYCSPVPVIHYRHVLERGEWFRSQAQFYRAQNIGCNFQARPVMSLVKALRKKPANWLRRLLNTVHSHWLCLRYPENLPDAG
jgi:hypothetical protein